MNTSVREDVATIFAAQLYSSIGFGYSLDKSFKQAMARLSIEGIEKQDADIPELYVRSGIDANEIYLVKEKKQLIELWKNKIEKELEDKEKLTREDINK